MRVALRSLLVIMLVGFAVLAWAQAPAPAVKLVSVMPEKVLYDEGVPVTGTVTVKNLTKTPQTVLVRAWLEWELNSTGNHSSAHWRSNRTRTPPRVSPSRKPPPATATP